MKEGEKVITSFKQKITENRDNASVVKYNGKSTGQNLRR
jgi:hypothetical protein